MKACDSSASSGRLTSQEVAQYHRDGFLVVRNLYGAQEMLAWKALLAQVLEEEKKQAGDTWDLNTSGVRVWNAQAIHPTLLAAMKDDHVTPVLRQIIGPDVEFLSAKVVFKNATTNFASPWHQDWFYWGGANKLSVWIALDDATPANGCLKLIPGTHQKVFPLTVANSTSFSHRISDKDLEGLPVVTTEARRGDAVFFSDLAVHGSHPNTSGGDRWSLISTYRNAAVLDECGLAKNLWQQPLLISGQSVNGGKT